MGPHTSFAPRRRPRPIPLWPLLVLGLFLLLAPTLVGRFFVEETPIAYSHFRSMIDAGLVDRIVLKDHEVFGTLTRRDTLVAKDVSKSSVVYQTFVTRLPQQPDATLVSDLRRAGTRIEVHAKPTRLPWAWMLLVLLAVAVLLFLSLGTVRNLRPSGREMFGFARSRARLYRRERPGITFEDVAGAAAPKAELREVIDFLRDGEAYRRLGARIPKGILLVGPPGTGKTLLARAVAGEAQVAFFHITGSDFMEMFVGVGAARVRDLFRDAHRREPSIVFVDELDSIGRNRSATASGNTDERDQTLNQLLAEMDGFEPHDKIVVLAATNRPEILDPALLRAGRFDRRVAVDLPTSGERAQILRVHVRNKPLAADVDLAQVARGLPGFSGADLANLLNEAALNAARRGSDHLERQDIDDARDKVLLGLPREGLVIGDDERRLLAYHESGHAVLSIALGRGEGLHKVTIVPHGLALGATQPLPEERHFYDREYLLDRLATMLGGRAAEDLVFGTVTNGGEDDLRKATRLAHRMVVDWGMGSRLPNVSLGGMLQEGAYSDDTAQRIDADLQELLGRAFDRARHVLEQRRTGLDRLAAELLEHEALSGARVVDILSGAVNARVV